MAKEAGASIIFTSEHSDKTRGSIREMRRATEMMALTRDRPYPKDLGIGLLVLKEKRRRREPPLEYDTHIPARRMPDEITYDPKGNFRIGIEGDQIVAVTNGKAVKGKRWQDVLYTLHRKGVTSRSSTMQATLAGNCTRRNWRCGTAGASSRTGSFREESSALAENVRGGPASGPLPGHGRAGKFFVFFLDPPREHPFGGGGTHRT